LRYLPCSRAPPRTQARFNLTKTVRKRPIDGSGNILGEWYFDRSTEMKHEEVGSAAVTKALASPPPSADGTIGDAAEGAVELTAATHAAAEGKYPLLLVNFYAPWCPWSQRLQPVWEAAARTLHGKYPTLVDGRILLAKVDCTKEVDLCREAQVQGFPSIRVFRGGSDLVTNPGMLGAAGGSSEHATYVGDRTVESLVAFAEHMLPLPSAQIAALPAGHYDADMPFLAAAAAGVLVTGKHPGCAIDGFVFVKKVPGALFVSAQSESHSFVKGAMNMSHYVHELYLGHKLHPRKVAELARLLPGGLPTPWADKLAGTTFSSGNENVTHEHFLQIVRTVVQPLRPRGARIDAYEYTVHSHAYEADGLPHAKFSLAPSPMLVFVQEEKRYGAYHFVTTVSALIGGVFTVASIADSATHAAARLLKKEGLGKHH
jgi:thiol-disulfide isomerase/thioredoxin